MSLSTQASTRFARIGLREKLLFSMLAAVLFISVAIALVSRYILVSSLTNELEMRGFAIAHSVAERGGSYILDNDIPKLLSLIFDEGRLRQRKDLVAYIFIENQDGNILAHTLPHNLPDNLRDNTIPPGKHDSIRLMELGGQEIYDLAAAINEGLYRIGTVHVGLNKRHIDSLVGKLRVAFLGFISAVIIITIILSSWLSKYITKPVSDLTRLSDEISRGNFDIPLKLGSGEDWDGAECPAFSNTDLPCWHFDQSRSGQRPGEAHRKCADCAFYRKHEGDEVVQLGDSFRNMLWSIKLYRRRLRESEEKYRSLFDSGPDPIFVVECATGKIRDANPRATELYGYPKQEIIGMRFLDLGPEHNIDCLTYFTDGGGGCVYYPKLIHYKQDGEPFFVNIHACPISYRGQHAIIIAVTDITELIEKDAQLIQAGKMKSLGEMSAGVAHEINQPLNAIKMGSEFLAKMQEEDLEIPKEHFLEVVREISIQVDRAAEIINTLRSFGRKSDLMAEHVDINQPIRAVLSMVRRQFELNNIRFVLELADNLQPVQAHSNRLQQVVFNLVANARDAINDASSPSDGDSDRRIIIRTGGENGRVYAEVEDTGSGIAEKDQRKIFEPFFTTKEAGQGMGLGLAITYGIIKDYGGEIRINSIQGKGTVFKIEFPAASKRGECKA
ncbi:MULTISPECIES: ATP-binding protein [unclassified Pseudodesulfovibrio]|uniref:ATP-binding protein n=1 Tax=unclassified Pseudodesulfovibrio TaxID=2661612 RepID=UPI000FEBBF8F|nr:MULTISPECIES: ATP-binding protein [unclassified Pseudodesulfovibrio]MCJ2164531.1 ATP-binding protein [Pseudodesulfovibrio sp. S3-i]RWU04729.1 PAS domain S-box protein [Pseudodesulfovibrio sp. S3]